MKGSCLCGAVTVASDGPYSSIGACHCSQCRKQSGHFWASVSVPKESLSVTGEVRWYAASPVARRGFCPVCGSFLFWEGHEEGEIGVSLGILEAPTGLRLSHHIFVDSKGDYYEIADGLPQEETENV